MVEQLPELAGGGVMVAVIAYLLASNFRDRGAARDVETQLRAQLTAKDLRINDLENEVDTERDRRRAAEDRAAEVQRGRGKDD